MQKGRPLTTFYVVVPGLYTAGWYFLVEMTCGEMPRTDRPALFRRSVAFLQSWVIDLK